MKSTGLRKRIISALVVSIAILATAGAPSPAAQDPGSMATEARAARVERELLPGIIIKGRPLPAKSLAERMAALKVPGLSVAVIEDDKIAWAKGYGILEAGSPAPVTVQTLFQAASLSKSLAALGAMRLVEQGKLALDEDVNARLKSWKVPENEFTKTEKVTLRRLLSHTAGTTVSGFGGYPAGAPIPTTVQILNGEKPANNAAVLPNVAPGSLWRYSGGGFTVAQLLMEEAAGKPFPALLSELVLAPLGMADSTYEQPLPDRLRGSAATAHDSEGKPFPGRWHTYPEMAAAGLWTTPSDLARFLLEIRKGMRGESSILSQETARLMTTAVKGGYGLGLSLQGSGRTARFGHGGSNEGFKCQMIVFTDQGQGAVIMTNGERGGWLADELLRAIAREYDWPSYKPVERTVIPVPAAELAALTGRYEMRPGKVFTIALEGETLFIKEGEWKTQLYPESPTRFFELDEEHTLVFEKDAAGKPAVLVIDGQIKAPRVGDK
jgi:CubicO group peptidase (beta-lactamase class C family)